jgi:hypothetical protein
MKQYKVYFRSLRFVWVSYAAAKGILEGWFDKMGRKHFCNQVSDPNACCPTAHGAPESACTCTCTSPDKFFPTREVSDASS